MNPPRLLATPVTRRPWPGGLCVLAAVALNASTLGWATRLQAPGNLAQPAPVLSIRTVAFGSGEGGRPAEAGSPLPSRRAAPVVRASKPPGSRALAAPDRPAAVAPSEDARTPRSRHPTPPIRTAHFYAFEEVEIPAAPVSDWAVDAAFLDGFRVPRIVFDLFVSDGGDVIRCAVVQPSELDPALRDALETRLRGTALRPARRGGQPVNSVRRIELFVS